MKYLIKILNSFSICKYATTVKLYHLLTGALQLVTMLSAFVALGYGTISLFHSGKHSHKQLLKENSKLTFSIFISDHELLYDINFIIVSA